MCRGGGMYAPTNIWRRRHRYASSLPPLVKVRGHRTYELKELPLIVSDGIESVQKKADEDDLSAKALMPQEEASAVLTATAQNSAKKAKKVAEEDADHDDSDLTEAKLDAQISAEAVRGGAAPAEKKAAVEVLKKLGCDEELQR
eukprot:2866948-Heterocapsa_arctica.AAC.1